MTTRETFEKLVCNASLPFLEEMKDRIEREIYLDKQVRDLDD